MCTKIQSYLLLVFTDYKIILYINETVQLLHENNIKAKIHTDMVK